MSSRIRLSVVALCVLALDARSEVHDIEWSTATAVDEQVTGLGIDLALTDGFVPTDATWPGRVVRVEIPRDARVEGIAIVPIAEDLLSYPAADYRVPAGETDLGAPAGQSQGYDYWILPAGDFRGHRIAHIVVSPFREIDESLLFLNWFELDVRTSEGHAPALARRVEHERTETADLRALRALLDSDPLPAQTSSQERASVPPELAAETVDYLIISNAAMEPTLQEFADFKTKEGLIAKITTVEWLLANYEGIDLAARMRTYIRDVYLYQGLRYVMLAGDTEQVPSRTAVNRFQNPPGARVSVDKYFGMLDGNWNADGDEEMGEAPNSIEMFEGDNVDLYYEIPVGRVPASTVAEAQTFVAKWKSYTGYDPGNFRDDYQDRFLAAAEVLFPDGWTIPDGQEAILQDGAEIAESTITYLPSCITSTRLYQNYVNYPGSIEETVEAFITEFNSGYGLVDHIGHGFRANMSVGDGKVVNSDADAFTNTNAYSVLYAVNCTSGAISFDCIVEHLMNNPMGGVVASIASTDLDFPTVSDSFKYEFFRQIFEEDVTTIGDAFFNADLPWVPLGILSENSYRWTIMTLLLIGDPAMEIWRCTPDTLDLAFTPDYELGTTDHTITVTDDGQPVEGVRVTLWKDDGYGVATTDVSGVVTIPFLPESEGAYQVTAVKNTFVPAIAAGTVTAPSTAALRVDGLTYHDGTGGGGVGNANGRPDAGETVVVDLTLRNDGSAPATGIGVTFRANSSFLTVSDSTAVGTDIPGSGVDTILNAFTFDVTDVLPDSLRHVVAPAEFELTTNEGVWLDERPFNVYQRLLDLIAQTCEIPGDVNGVLDTGETIEMTLTLFNRGEADALSVVGVGVDEGTGFVMTNDTVNFGTVAAGDSATAGPISLLSIGGNRFSLAVGLTVSDSTQLGRSSILNRGLDVIVPPAPDTLYAEPGSNSIRLIWPKPNQTDIRGYRVFRADSESGPFVEVTNDYVEDGSFFVDEGLTPLTPYLYRVATVDSSGNASALSDTLITSTSPPTLEGFPVELPSGESKGSPTFSDVDFDFSYEIVLGWSYPIAFRADGSDFVDGDMDGLTSGIFSTIGGGESKFWTSPAVFDLDNDNVQEIVFAAWQYDVTSAQLWVLDATGAVEAGWPQDIGSTPWSTAAVGDIDLDGDLEIFVSSGGGGGVYQGALMGFHHDGTEVADGDANGSTHGIFYKSAGLDARFMYTSPAMADMDDDGEDEIIYFEKTSHTDDEGQLIVLDGDGSMWPGFPYGDAGTRASTSSPAIADIDDNGDLEIIALTQNELLVVNDDGSDFPGYPLTIPAIPGTATGIKDFVSSPALGDLDNDGEVEIVFGWLDAEVYAITATTATSLPGFPVTVMDFGSIFDKYLRSPVLGNIDGDPNPEIVVSSSNDRLFAVKYDATQLPGFPLQLAGTVFGSTALWDINGDGFVNLIVQSTSPVLEVFNFNTVPFLIEEHPWPMFRHDQRKSGFFEVPVAIDVDDPVGPDTTPVVAAVRAARPNPFIPRVDLPFDVPDRGEKVKIRVFDVKGREVRTLADGQFPGGTYRISWDGRTASGQRLSAGVYFARIEIGGEVFRQKLTMVR